MGTRPWLWSLVTKTIRALLAEGALPAESPWISLVRPPQRSLLAAVHVRAPESYQGWRVAVRSAPWAAEKLPWFCGWWSCGCCCGSWRNTDRIRARKKPLHPHLDNSTGRRGPEINDVWLCIISDLQTRIVKKGEGNLVKNEAVVLWTNRFEWSTPYHGELSSHVEPT